MDALVWNKTDLVREFPSEEFLLGALQKIERRLAESGCVVCEIFVNGHKIPEDSETQVLADQTLVGVDDFKVGYQSIELLVQRSFSSISAMIPKIIRAAEQTADFIHQGQHRQAAHLIAQLMESCYWLTETLAHLKGLFSIRQDVVFPLDAWQVGEINLRTVIQAMLNALEQGDFVALADYLQGQLVKVLQLWQNLAEQIDQLITVKPTPPAEGSNKVGAE